MNAENQTGPKFQLGRILSTPGALALLEECNENATSFIRRHLQGDWGDLCDEDTEANDRALVDGNRLLSAYTLTNGEKIWLITEAEDDDGDRSATTILLPSEY